jgi:hypothetical protein
MRTHAPIEELVSAFNYYIAEIARMQIEGEYSDGTLAFHNC